jgi:hypothetical protein
MALTKISGEVIQSSVNVGVVTASQINVGSAVTIHSAGFRIGSSDLHSTGLSIQNINSTGVVTATSIVATTGTFSGNVSVAGTVTYEDVTNVDSVGVVTARSGIRVSAGSSVGIGTNNPNNILDIRSSDSDSGINLGRPSLTPTISLSNNGGQNSGRAIIRHNNNSVIEFRADGAGSYINTGNLGIGTDNPTSTLVVASTTNSNYTSSNVGYSVDIKNLADYVTYPSSTAGIRLFSGNANSGGGVIAGVRVGPSNQGDIVLAPTDATGNAVEKVRVTSGGNIGIGLTNPTSKLQINYSSSTAYSTTASPQTANSIALFNTDTTATTTFSSIVLGNRRNGNSGIVGIECVGTGNDATALTFKTQSAGPVFSEVMRLTSTGRIGIGTDSIADKVVIVDSMVKNPSSAGWGIVVSDSNIDGVAGRGGAIAFGARRTDGGQFNCGAISGAKSNSTGMNENGDLVLWSSVSSSLTERMRILSGGNVGVGISDPSYKLDVYGEFRVRGTASTNRSFYVGVSGQTNINIANNGNETNLVLDNVGDITSTTNHGSNILFRTNDNNSATTAIDSGKISVIKTQQWTSTSSTRNSSLEISVAKGGSLQNRLTINGANNQATFFVRQRSNSSSEDTSLANHQYLFVEPDGDAPGYYRRSVASQYKGFNQYSYWAIRYDGASYDYTGSMKCRITWSTSHASGAGFAEFSLAVRSGDSDGGPAPAGNIIQYGAVQYSGGWFYGWTGNPDFDVYYAGFNENKQFLVLRLSGYMNHNGNTYDGGVHETVDLQSWGNAFQGIYRIGTSAPSGYTLNAITKTILT